MTRYELIPLVNVGCTEKMIPWTAARGEALGLAQAWQEGERALMGQEK